MIMDLLGCISTLLCFLHTDQTRRLVVLLFFVNSSLLFHSKKFKCKIFVVVVSYPYYMNEK